MPDPDDTASSWPGLLGQVNKTFDLIRDVFGYALPGAVFLAIGLISRRYTLDALDHLLSPYTLTAWAAFIVVVAASYAAGNVMAAIVYMPIGLFKWGVWMYYRHLGDRYAFNKNSTEVNVGGVPIAGGRTAGITYWQAQNDKAGVVIKRRVLNTTDKDISVGGETIGAGKTANITVQVALNLPAGVVLHDPDPPQGSVRDWLVNNPTEVTPRTLERRLGNQNLFKTLDRRETLNVMSGSMAAALLSGYCVFYRYCAYWQIKRILFWGGAIALVQFLTGLSHIRRVLQAVHMAKVPDESPGPDFPKLVADLMDATTAALKKYADKG